MATLAEQLKADLKEALLARDTERTSTLRMLQATLQNASIAAQQELGDDDILAVIRKEAKKRQEAADMYRAAGETERAEKEEQELTMLSAYLPAAASDEDVAAFIKDYVANNEVSNPGQAIKATLAHFEGRADGKLVAQLVNQNLNA